MNSRDFYMLSIITYFKFYIRCVKKKRDKIKAKQIYSSFHQ